MMNLFVLLFGIAIPTGLCWLLLGILQRHTAVLTRAERMAWALTLGPTLFTFIAFVSYALHLTQFTLMGFLLPALVVGMIFLGIAIRTKSFGSAATLPDMHPVPKKWMRIGIIILLLWTALKIAAGAFDLATVPTFWDDSFNNWNMRGKAFYVTHTLPLEIPLGDGGIQTAEGVSSYPPSVPLIKTWLATIRGNWNDGLVNTVHLVWFVGLLLSFYLFLKPRMGKYTAAFGVYILSSLPLVMIHGTNPYADMVVASHLFLAMVCVIGIAEASDTKHIKSWLLLLALTSGLLLFTKNEATVLYAPVLLIVTVWVLTKKRSTQLDAVNTKSIASFLLILGCLALPWISFKWINGLTFGNAKSVSGQTLTFNTAVPSAIWYHLSKEANWLLLPLISVITLIASWRRALKFPEGLLTVFLGIVMLAQASIFTFIGPLATEAINQTGLSRGFLHIMPLVVLLTMMLGEKLLKEHQTNS
jgi:hypothetical protein